MMSFNCTFFYKAFIVLLLLSACKKTPLDEVGETPSLSNADFNLSQSCTLSGQQDASLSCQIESSDLTIQNLTWSFETANTCSWLSIDSTTGLVSGTPNDDQVGACQLVVVAQNSERKSFPLSESINIVNTLPTLTVSSIATLSEDVPSSSIFSDVQVQASEEGFGIYSINSAAGLSPRCSSFANSIAIDSVTGAIQYAPALNFNGNCYMRIVFDDGNTGLANADVLVQISPVNDAPTLTSLDNISGSEGILIGPLSFTVEDVDSLVTCTSTHITAVSSNQNLIPNSSIVISGTYPNCTMSLQPNVSINGSTTITYTISDLETPSLQSSHSFVVDILPYNDPPVISNILNQTTLEDTAEIIAFTISDVDSNLDCATSVVATISDPSVISQTQIIFSGIAPACVATLNPNLNANGSSIITLTVSDGFATDTVSFTQIVSAVNDAPTIVAIADDSVKTDDSITINYTINDIDSTIDCVSSITASSGNTGILPNANITKAGTYPNCQLVITATLNVAGTSSISVAVSDGILSNTDVFNLNLVNLTSLGLNSTSVTVAVSTSSPLTATAFYSDSTFQDVTISSQINWSSSNTSVITVGNAGSTKGRITGVSVGSTSVTARYKNLSASANVSAISITSVSVSQGFVSGGIGSTAFVTATAQSTTSAFSVTNTGLWTTSDASVATVNNGLIQFNAAGTCAVSVSYGGLTATVNVQVLSKSLLSIAIVSPGGDFVQQSGTKFLSAIATYSDASTQNVTNSAHWVSANSSVATISNTSPYIGQIIGIAAGTSQISAQVGAVTGSVLMTVTNPTMTSIAITPFDALLTSVATQQYTAIATYSDATTADVTQLATWASTNSTAATISNSSTTRGLATTPSFTGYRTTNITATLNAVVGSTPLGVNGAAITSILITPNVSLTVGSTYQMRAYANLVDGGSIDITAAAVWTSSSPAIMSVSNSDGTKGLITAVTAGSSLITVNYGGLSGQRTVSVGAVEVIGEVGTGLTGNYYTYTGGSPPANPFILANRKGVRTDATVAFTWNNGSAPMGVGDLYAVRWTGFYKANTSSSYFCTYSDDGVRVWINGVLVINNWTDHASTWNCTGNIALTSGTKYPVVIEFYENGGQAYMVFTQSTVSAADAQNTTTRIVPQSQLFPQ